ncbi:hypothetical protein QYM36_010329 [Artemia franciscana]|uniref:Reverse transcriptase domain-containing protein n=1 Tax=Artemia franciscana TaxID=6661 RepID=A0AA88HT38_ARTSF|nr:hypothetical protein QYM36_010329 [Artemia franciscana]
MGIEKTEYFCDMSKLEESKRRAQLRTFEVQEPQQIKKEIDAVQKYKYPVRKYEDASVSSRKTKECYFCGGVYSPTHTCPAKGKPCAKCKKPNHFARVCKSNKSVNVVIEYKESPADNSDKDEDVFLYAIENKTNKSRDEALITLEANHYLPIKFKVDTGAQANILPAKYFDALSHPPSLKRSSQNLTSYCGSKIPVRGVCELSCKHKSSKAETLPFFIVETDSVLILGFRSSIDLDIVKLVLNVSKVEKSTCKDMHVIDKTKTDEIISSYNDFFQGIGKLHGECHLYLKDDAVPTVYPARRIPSLLRGKLEAELKRMEEQGIIEKVSKPTDWVNSMVAVEKKDGSLRICIDPVDLNKSIRRPFYPIPSLEDVTSKLHGVKYLSKLDARLGYWSLVLDDEFADLTTFNTIFGRYRFKRMPFGIISAQDEFQRRIEEALEGLDGFAVIIDDLLVFGSTLEEHNKRLVAVLERGRAKGIKFNKAKCSFCVTNVTYFGHVISGQGMQPDPDKLKAINNMPTPSNSEELATLLGMLNYLAKYIPNLSTQNKTLRDLSKATEFKWAKEHDEALQNIKNSTVSNLAYFDHSCKSIDLTVDASSHGLGAYISSNGNVIAYASRSLSEAE